jgi:hypothetical protein
MVDGFVLWLLSFSWDYGIFEIQDGSKLLPALNIYTGFSRQKILHRNGLKKSREVRMIELLNIIFIFPAIGKINYLLS